MFRTGGIIVFTIKSALDYDGWGYGGWVSVMEVRISVVSDDEKFRFSLRIGLENMMGEREGGEKESRMWRGFK